MFKYILHNNKNKFVNKIYFIYIRQSCDWPREQRVLHFTYHLSDKTHGFGWRFIHSGGVSSVILHTRERAAHVANHMIVGCK